MTDERFHLLVEKYLENRLSDDEARELLEAPEPYRARLLDEVTMAGMLERVEGKAPADLAAKVQAALRARSEKDAMVGRVMGHLPKRRTSFRPFLALAAAALILLTLYLVFRPGPATEPARTAELPKKTAPVIAPAADVKPAVAKAVEFLKKSKLVGASHNPPQTPEDLVLWAYVNAGVPQDDPAFEKLLKQVLGAKLQRTYCVSLQAMALQRIDPVKHRDRIADCAQFLVDNQCLNGQWSYGAPTLSARYGGVVKKTRDGPLSGNNSCSQFAAMALRACVDAGIAIPPETFERAIRGWHESRRPEADGRIGWCYTRDESPHRPYGSMTAGAVGSLAILHKLLGRDWRQDKIVQAGVAWVSYHFTVTENFGPVEELMAKEMISDTPNQQTELYYWLWAVERSATVCGLDKLNDQDWYKEGVHELLATQRADGSWYSGVKRCNPVWDTCYAILFLTRATRPFAE